VLRAYKDVFRVVAEINKPAHADQIHCNGLGYSPLEVGSTWREDGMLKGFTVPKSPFGQASLTPPPPWHYASDVVGVEFWTDPGASAATLPIGLSPDPKSNGHAFMMFFDWQFTAQDDEYLDPARYQYREALVLLDATYRDTPVMWCPYIFVDNDAALARGWTQGFPKKLGSIFQTRTFAATSPAAAPVAAGGRFGASLSSHGQRLAEARITLRKPVENGLSLLSRPTVLLRYFPRLAAGYHDKPAVDELTMSITDNLTVAEAWTGEGELNLPEAQGEELHSLAPSRVVSGFRYSLSYSVADLRILEEYAS
jgi:acetoacetate decarboxylase